MSRKRLGGLLLLALLPLTGWAEVKTGANGFLVRHEMTVGAPPARVYDALVREVGLWWSPSHTFSGDARNLSIDARPGGCFCEKYPNGGGIEHLRVVHAAPDRLLRLAGGLGPLQAHGLAGSLSWRLTAEAGGTRLELSYSVGGFMPDGFEKIAPAVDRVLGEQAQRLKLFVETGKPAA
jgi:uncharacterized protein YndB with AHSA1/START domain